ncbi:MAG: hypothetical protein HKO01_07765 [Flaviramulus sp.]|nr:hypothetical protein [Flaviramulus sp.]NNC50415.1 hypothetical protein [Flaviramulus sp.]
MHKNTIAIFFSILLLGLISAPSIIIAFDDAVDISVFFSVTEEEETSKIKLPSPINLNDTDCIVINNRIDAIAYYCKKYPKPHLNLIFPPPECFII